MLFGLSGAPATFQRMADQLLAGLEDCTSAYIDDIIVFSDTWEDHLKHVANSSPFIEGGRAHSQAKELPIWYVRVCLP